MTTFWLSQSRDTHITYDELVAELSQREVRKPVVQTDSPSELFIQLLLALVEGGDLVLLDDEFSTETISELGYSPDATEQTVSIDVNLDDPIELSTAIENADEDWALGLYTSGTTGIPSRVDQSLEGLTRRVRRDDRFQDHVWAFAYNPSHFAGLQVFFQAILNQNPMIYIFDQNGDEIEVSLKEHQITHISATPTFYRLRMSGISGRFPSVERLTSGGEKFEPSLRKTLEGLFPNAEFRNVYALTEAGSLLESDGELFHIPDKLEDSLRISEDDELVVHQSLLGDTSSEERDEDWYHTGDLVEFVDDDRFKFVGRQSEFVNIGGYRVNPHSIEEQINSVEGVQAAVVAARESSVTGHILVAEVQLARAADPDKVDERIDNAMSSLERWKRPRIVEMVEEIDQSRSGKRTR